DVRCEAALRADRELVQGQEPARLLDAPLQEVRPLDRRGFRAYQAKDRDRSRAHEAEGLEAAGALRVVFEQEPLVVQRPEELLRNGVVVPFAVPHARLVPPAQMDAKYDVRERVHNG